MSDEKENIREMKLSVWETDWVDDVQDAMNSLIDEFDAYNCEVRNYFKVTITYMREEEEHRDD